MKFRERYHYLFKQSFGPLCKVMEYEDQQCLLLFLLELKRHREKLLKDNNTATQVHPQRTITATTPSSDTQMGSWSGHKKGDIIDRATAICSACWPSPHAARPQHPCHRQIRAIISLHRRCFPCFGEFFILDQPMLETFRRPNLSNLRMLNVSIMRFFSHGLSFLLSYIYLGLFSKTRIHFKM